MTPKEIQAECQAIQELVSGRRPRVSVTIDAEHDGPVAGALAARAEARQS